VESTAMRYSSYGDPFTVLKREKETLSTKLSGNEVLVKLLAAPINPADLNMIEGIYGTKPTLPAVAGQEGVGEVVSVGPSVKDLKVGDRIIPAQPEFGTWRTYALSTEDKLQKIAKDIPLEYAATLAVNPSTAYRLIHDFAPLQAGDVIIQNGANSVVGTSVIQLAKAKGIKTINILREDRTGFPETVERLKEWGGDLVVSDKYSRTPQFKRLIANLPAPKLALNCIGGESATEMARTLAPQGTLVTYGGMSRQPVSIPTSLFIFRDIQLRGFWLSKWVREHSASERTEMLDILSKMVRNKTLQLYLETHKFSEFDHALARAVEPFRDRKVVLELTH